MKTSKTYLLFAMLFCFFLTACDTVAYLGERYPVKNDLKVYYAARDVKRDYKVIGHLSNAVAGSEETSKNEIIEKAKKVGADAVIFTGFGTTAGKNGSDTITADAIQYTDGKQKETTD
ncbi:hypothetical protein [Mucilaginibacter glaciei]|uniref:DUF4156 domain-containing protein n=1 Tax=Mucilaginibacter glaciei TaxID=2772109 RepID=A0A926NPM2_9SPHI|nr:hypothetical protein [Mucilaginibacter glaciei]MBD1393078.1 hypothetical protein [Mucilaginibacter glaciei]